MAIRKQKKSPVRRQTPNVGDIVQFKFGAEDVKGKVVEDRGHVGFKGRGLYRVVVMMDVGEPMNIELPADEIRVYRRAPAVKKVVRPRVVRSRKAHAQPQKKQELSEV